MGIQRILFTAGASLVILLGHAPALAQSAAVAGYPNRPIRLIVPFPPGGGAEATARVVAQRVSEGLGQPIVIESRAGAGGNIGSEAVARATPDGYTLLFTTSGVTVAPHLQKLAWDPLKDLAPISLVVTYPLVIAAHPSTPATTLRELIAYARANPGKLSYGSSGTGGPLHMGAELFKNQTGIDLLHVAYKGNAPATLAILSGEVNLTFDSQMGPAPNIRAGKLRGLAVTGTRRSAVLPEVPTVIETGVANFSYEAWNGITAPAGTPPDILRRLNAEVVKAIALPEVRERLSAMGYDPVSNSIVEYAALMQADYQRFGKLVREIGLRADQ